MLKPSLFVSFLFCASSALASVIGEVAQFEAYSLANGGPAMLPASRSALVGLEAAPEGGLRLAFWNLKSPPAPEQGDLPPLADAEIYLAAHAASAEAARQEAKPQALKALENDFFSFVRLVLTAAGDPRASATPTPKLGFEELTPMIEGIQATDPMTAISLTLKGLSIDSALKRYSPVWWDDAQEHNLE